MNINVHKKEEKIFFGKGLKNAKLIQQAKRKKEQFINMDTMKRNEWPQRSSDHDKDEN